MASFSSQRLPDPKREIPRALFTCAAVGAEFVDADVACEDRRCGAAGAVVCPGGGDDEGTAMADAGANPTAEMPEVLFAEEFEAGALTSRESFGTLNGASESERFTRKPSSWEERTIIGDPAGIVTNPIALPPDRISILAALTSVPEPKAGLVDASLRSVAKRITAPRKRSERPERIILPKAEFSPRTCQRPDAA
jgi:hypothetical protein